MNHHDNDTARMLEWKEKCISALKDRDEASEIANENYDTILALRKQVAELKAHAEMLNEDRTSAKFERDEARRQVAELTRERDELIPMAYETRPGMDIPPVTWQQHSQDVLAKLYATQDERDAALARAEAGEKIVRELQSTISSLFSMFAELLDSGRYHAVLADIGRAQEFLDAATGGTK